MKLKDEYGIPVKIRACDTMGYGVNFPGAVIPRSVPGIIYGLKEGIKIFDVFIDGAKDGMNIVLALFPTLIGLFVAIGALRSSGLIDGLINILSPIFNFLNIPKAILPLALLRPISR